MTPRLAWRRVKTESFLTGTLQYLKYEAKATAKCHPN